MKRSFPLVLFLLVLGCASAPPRAAEPVHVVIVSTTDVHGWFNGHIESPPGGGAGVLWGGLPTLASYIDALRDRDPGRVLVVDSGDLFQGTLESNLFEGEPVVRGYNAIGYTAAAVGNHEFDFGPVGPDSVARTPGQDPLGTIKRNAELAMFPFLSANMLDRATHKTPSWARPYTLVRAGAARIGIIGLSTPDTPNTTTAANVASLEFTDPVPAAVAAAKELRAQGADAVIVIAHMGGRCNDVSDPHVLAGCETQQEAMEFLQRIPPGTIDAYFAGHTHAQMRHYVNGVPAVQGLAFSREFGTVDLWIDAQHDRVTKSELRPLTMICSFVYSGTETCDPKKAPAGATLVPRVFAGETIAPVSRVASVIDPYLRRTAAKREEKLGIRTSAAISRAYMEEAPLGDVLADALRAATGADLAMMNSGGIRSDLPAGELTYADVFAVSPFDNYPAVVALTGAEVTGILQAMSGGARGIMQVSGLRYTIDEAKDADKPAAERNRVTSITLEDSSPLDPAKLYRVAMPDFIAAGGDGTQDVMKNVPKDRIQIFYSTALRDAIIDPMRKMPQPLTPDKRGRVTILNHDKAPK
ncbi:MAG: 5'-nucleotidase C-terminal domain-containing protein [Acidobacteria bacterium]|nr:5'-nucleotidase C-terminal domain-containing protein [Acidobacteriota bacterium]MBV9476331.1 5'-nucleotidase C-terminal domain-containing protein [Acidobacteriota bacterium]